MLVCHQEKLVKPERFKIGKGEDIQKVGGPQQYNNRNFIHVFIFVYKKSRGFRRDSERLGKIKTHLN